MIRILYISLIWAIPLFACASQPTLIPTPVLIDTPKPSNTSTPVPPTPIPIEEFIELKSGGFSLIVQPDLEFDIDDFSITLSDHRGDLVISLNGKPYIESNYTLESFLGKYVDEIAGRGGVLIPSDPYDIIIDGIDGIAVDLSGIFLGAPIAGKAIIISPGKDFVFFGLGMSNQSSHENSWGESGSLIFETLIDTVKFKEEVKK